MPSRNLNIIPIFSGLAYGLLPKTSEFANFCLALFREMFSLLKLGKQNKILGKLRSPPISVL